ncbi:MAG: Glu/Leu/Phe/Val dehydrogenase dimerization domain-containing protein [Pseudomonadota bacterium]
MILKELDTTSHEKLVRVSDEATGLVGFIAIHSTCLGPALGGLRFWPYGSEADAIEDVLKLSKGMTYKNAAADLPLGGGKAAIIGDPKSVKSPELLKEFGEAVDALEGAYWTAEDMGVDPNDMEVVATSTRFVSGRKSGPFASGDPAPVTARGVFNAICLAARHVFGTTDLNGRCVALQGLGNVGMQLGKLLHDAGAALVLSDIDRKQLSEAVERFGARSAEPDQIYDADADFFAPCAVGGILNEATIARLKVRIVAGSANNQLARPEDGARLFDRDILYAPDYVANTGGAINAATEILMVHDRPSWVAEKLASAQRLLESILTEARMHRTRPELIADRLVKERLEADSLRLLRQSS